VTTRARGPPRGVEGPGSSRRAIRRCGASRKEKKLKGTAGVLGEKGRSCKKVERLLLLNDLKKKLGESLLTRGEIIEKSLE